MVDDVRRGEANCDVLALGSERLSIDAIAGVPEVGGDGGRITCGDGTAAVDISPGNPPGEGGSAAQRTIAGEVPCVCNGGMNARPSAAGANIEVVGIEVSLPAKGIFRRLLRFRVVMMLANH